MTWGEGNAAASAAEHRIERPPSMVELAAGALRRMILGGDLLPGQRVVENQLTRQLGVSRPPLREAMRLLEREGLIQHHVQRGAVVTPLTVHDVYEIFTLRRNLERMAVDLGVPVRVPALLERCRAALTAMEDAAERGDRAAMSECAFEFHLSVIGLSGHRRLEATYRSLQLQMLLCMALNRQAREQQRETMLEDAARHRRLLERIEAGDPQAVHHELAHHGDRTFLQGLDEVLEEGSEVARAWLDRIRSGEDAS